MKEKQPDLFSAEFNNSLRTNAPLAERVRPASLEEFVGQEHIAGEGKLLNRMIKADKLSSVIFFGPPGSGKTTLAEIIAQTTQSEFLKLNAVTSGVGDIKEVIKKAESNLALFRKRTIVFIDEIHRFNKSQQDALLPAVENGTIILIGATTENPYFEINAALVSRSTVFELYKLTPENIKTIIKNAVADKSKGLGEFNIRVSDEALNHWADISDGDSRIALNALELAFLTTPKNKENITLIDLAAAEDCIQKKVVKYDKSGEGHYDTISAFIKSMRGSDPDAAVYWLAKMLYAGEDPKFIARRMVVFASEDISNADPYALTLAVSAFRAVEIIGLPECRINLAQAACYLACAPKANGTYMALAAADGDIRSSPTGEVPMHLRNAVTKARADTGVGRGYKYPHDFPHHWVKQQYLPDGFEDKKYYRISEQGYEKTLKEYLEKLKGEK